MESDDDHYEQGEVTLEELQEGYQPAFNFDDEISDEMRETAWAPNEETVMDLAALWSVRVDDLEALYPKQLSVGFVLTRQLRKT
ncbi:MAG: hypothetical protein ACMZI2_01715 [Candidatus Symbiodolus clandestinus]